jgi:TP901 family phage tail tape measure protein
MAEAQFGPITTRLDLNTDSFDKGIAGSINKLGQLRQTFADFTAELRTAANVAIGAGAALGIGIAPGVLASQQLEQALARSFSVGELAREEMARLRQATLRLGEGVVGAEQLADGLYNLASAGFDVNQQLATLPVISKLAIASAVDLDAASQLVVQALRAFNLEATDAARVGNLVAASNAVSSSNALRLADSYRMVAATAASIGLSIEETTTSLNFLINVMQSGEMAGTGLRNVLGRLAGGGTELQEAAVAAGISLRDLNPATAGMASALSNLNLVLEKGGSAFRIFGLEGQTAALILAGQASAFQEMQDRISGTNELQRQYGLQMTTTINRLTSLRNAISSTAVSYGQGLKPAIDLGIESLRVLNEVVNSIPQGLKSLIGVVSFASAGILFFGGLWARVGLAMAEAGIASRVLGWALQRTGRISSDVAKNALAVVATTELRVKALLLERVAEQQAAAAAIAGAQLRVRAITAEAAAKAQAAAVDLATKAAQAKAAVQLATAQTAASSISVAASTAQVAAMFALRQAVAIVYETTKRFYAFVFRLLALPLTRWLVLAALALRAMAEQGAVLRPAIDAMEDTFRRWGAVLAPVSGIITEINRAFSTLALRGVVMLGDALNWLNRSFETTAALGRFLSEIGRNPFTAGQAYADLTEELGRLQQGFLDVEEEITNAGQEAYRQIHGIAGDAVDSLAERLGVTNERLIEMSAAMSAFMDDWNRRVERITFDIDATPLQRQLAAVDDQVRSEISALQEFANSPEGELLLLIDIDGNAVEDQADSMFNTLLDRVRTAGEEASRLLQDQFVAELQDSLDADWVASIQSGTQRANEEYRRRTEALTQQRADALRSLQEGSAQYLAAEQVFNELFVLARQQLVRDLEQVNDAIAQQVAQAEREVANAQVDAMLEGADKIRAQYELQVADARARSQERLEAVADDADARAAVIAAEGQLVGLLYERMERDIEEHERAVSRAARNSQREFERTLGELRSATARFEAANTGNGYEVLLVQQAQALEAAGERVRETLRSFEDAVAQGQLGEAEGAQRALAVLAEWGRQEAALQVAQAAERRTYFAEREAELIRHNRAIAAIYARAAAVDIEDPTERAASERSTALADLAAWHAERIALAGEDATERLRIEERFAADSVLINANYQAAVTQIAAQARRERIDAEAAAAERLRSSGIAGVITARDLTSSINALRAVSAELRAAGATAEDVQPLAEALAAASAALVDLRREAADFEGETLSRIADEMREIDEGLSLSDEGQLRAGYERRVAALDDELAAARSYLASRYSDEQQYQEAVARLDAAYAQLREGLRAQETARRAEDARVRTEAAIANERELGEQLAAARVALIANDVERLEANAALEGAARRRAHEQQIADLRLTYEERQRLQRTFLELEQTFEEQHQREVAEIRQRQADAEADLATAAASARVALLRGDVERLEANFALETAARRRDHERTMNDLQLDNEQRLRMQRSFDLLERTQEEQHQRELTALRRRIAEDALRPFVLAEETASRMRAGEAEADARAAAVVGIEDEVAAREQVLEGQEAQIEATKREIAALKERNGELLASLTNLSRVRSYYEQVQELFGQPLTRQDPKQVAQQQLRDAEALYRQAVQNNLPLAEREALLRDLIVLNERAKELGLEGVRADSRLAEAARVEYQAAAEETKGAIERWGEGEAALAALNGQLAGFELQAEAVKEELQSLKDALTGINDELGRMSFNQATGELEDLATVAARSSEEYRASLAKMVGSAQPGFNDLQIRRVVGPMLQFLEQGQLERAMFEYIRGTGEMVPAWLMEGLLAAPVPGGAGESLAESAGIDDVGAYVEEAGARAAAQYLKAFGHPAKDAPKPEEVLPVDDELDGLQERVVEAGTAAGKGLMEAFADGISSNRQTLLNAVESVLADVRQRLPSSDAKKGPLSDLTRSGRALVRTWVGGAESQSQYLAKHIDGLFGAALPSGAAVGASRQHSPLGGGGGAAPLVGQMNIDGRSTHPSGIVDLTARQFVDSVRHELNAQRRMR